VPANTRKAHYRRDTDGEVWISTDGGVTWLHCDGEVGTLRYLPALEANHGPTVELVPATRIAELEKRLAAGDCGQCGEKLYAARCQLEAANARAEAAAAYAENAEADRKIARGVNSIMLEGFNGLQSSVDRLTRMVADLPGERRTDASADRWDRVRALADRIEPALREVKIMLGPNSLKILRDGGRVPLSGGELDSLAVAAAQVTVRYEREDISDLAAARSAVTDLLAVFLSAHDAACFSPDTLAGQLEEALGTIGVDFPTDPWVVCEHESCQMTREQQADEAMSLNVPITDMQPADVAVNGPITDMALAGAATPAPAIDLMAALKASIEQAKTAREHAATASSGEAKA